MENQENKLEKVKRMLVEAVNDDFASSKFRAYVCGAIDMLESIDYLE